MLAWIDALPHARWHGGRRRGNSLNQLLERGFFPSEMKVTASFISNGCMLIHMIVEEHRRNDCRGLRTA